MMQVPVNLSILPGGVVGERGTGEFG